ncbi:MAG: MaoC/PaaZ C-terminal domain-containing protein [Nitriliruptoraceae bacterium]
MSTSTMETGTEIPTVTATADRATLVRYAGASGDFNPLHLDEGFAAGVSPTGGIIAHGMLAMGLASRAVTAFAGGPEHVLDVQVRFARPWPVDTATTFGGKVTGIDGDVATLSLWGDNEDGTRLLRGSAKVRCQRLS